MANECIFCERRRIETNMLVLNGGEFWVEFCQPCGEREVLHNAETGDTLLVRELWDRTIAEKEGRPFVRNAADIAYAAELWASQAERAELAAAREAYHAAVEAAMDEHHTPVPASDHWDNLAYRLEHSRRYTAPRWAA